MVRFQPARAAQRFRRRNGKTKAAKPADHRLVFTRLPRLRLLGVRVVGVTEYWNAGELVRKVMKFLKIADS